MCTRYHDFELQICIVFNFYQQIQEILQHHEIHHSNVKVVSNFLEYDDNGKVSGLAGEVIHIYNKNESAIQVR